MGGTYRDLAVLQGAMDLSASIYRVTRKFPSSEIYGLTAQMRRASVSIASNIAEGQGRFSDKKLLQFLSHARGSAYEVQTQIELARMLGYLTKPDEQELVEKSQSIGRMLNKLIASIRESTRSAA